MKVCLTAHKYANKCASEFRRIRFFERYLRSLLRHMEKKKVQFSGHDSFECRPFWLKKGFDFIQSGKKFTESAVVDLGVGKNMVTAISYWLRAFGIADSDYRITPFGQYLLNDDGADPYLEDEASIWLLHYHLVKSDVASIYNLVFNKYRRTKPEFSKEQIVRLASSDYPDSSQKTLEKDVEVLIKTYSNKPEEGEETYGGLLSELQLLIELRSEGRKSVYTFRNERSEQIPPEILLYCILDSNPDNKIIGFEEMLARENSVGKIFVLNRESLTIGLEAIASQYRKELTYSDSSGVRQIQFKRGLNKEELLNHYYQRTHV